MAHNEMDDSLWAEERLASLDPGGWQPDSISALRRLRGRQAPRRLWWVWATTVSAAACAACALLLLVSTRPACANPRGCSQPVPAVRPPAVEAAAPALRNEANFKQSGSPGAPVLCELYTDYECPHCAVFYLETLPQFVAAYVDSGKVRLIHRDFPLARHRYARLAARYADAAGQLGYYQATAAKLFRTQEVWSADGDIEGQVARAVPPAVLPKVRQLAQNDPAPEASIAADEAAARENRIDHTPSLVCNRQAIPGQLTFPEIRASLDRIILER